MEWLLLLFVLGMLWILKKRKKLKKWYVVITLTALGAAAFAQTPLGAWVASRVLGGVLRVPARWMGAPTAGLAATLMLLLIVIVVYDIIKDHKADKPAVLGVFVLPLLFLIAAGPVAGNGARLTQAVAAVATSGYSALVGG